MFVFFVCLFFGAGNETKTKTKRYDFKKKPKNIEQKRREKINLDATQNLFFWGGKHNRDDWVLDIDDDGDVGYDVLAKHIIIIIISISIILGGLSERGDGGLGRSFVSG